MAISIKKTGYKDGGVTVGEINPAG